MAKSVKTFKKSRVESGGFNSSGNAQNNKLEVVGELNITAYTAAGEPLTPSDVGLSTIDFIDFDVRSVNDAATVPVATAIPLAAYDQTGQRVIIIIDHGTDTPVTTGEAAVVRFRAVGDSTTPELT